MISQRLSSRALLKTNLYQILLKVGTWNHKTLLHDYFASNATSEIATATQSEDSQVNKVKQSLQ